MPNSSVLIRWKVSRFLKSLSSFPVGFARFKLWLSLRYHGLQTFRAAIQKDLDHAQRLAGAIESAASLELVGPVELSAVCFRHILSAEASEEVRNRFNLALLKRIVARGRSIFRTRN